MSRFWVGLSVPAAARHPLPQGVHAGACSSASTIPRDREDALLQRALKMRTGAKPPGNVGSPHSFSQGA
jgi:hypothetical protein